MGRPAWATDKLHRLHRRSAAADANAHDMLIVMGGWQSRRRPSTTFDRGQAGGGRLPGRAVDRRSRVRLRAARTGIGTFRSPDAPGRATNVRHFGDTLERWAICTTNMPGLNRRCHGLARAKAAHGRSCVRPLGYAFNATWNSIASGCIAELPRSRRSSNALPFIALVQHRPSCWRRTTRPMNEVPSTFLDKLESAFRGSRRATPGERSADDWTSTTLRCDNSAPPARHLATHGDCCNAVLASRPALRLTTRLEPHFDALTMGNSTMAKHHQNLASTTSTAALEQAGLPATPVERPDCRLGSPAEKRCGLPVPHNGGGPCNHSLFWSVLSPPAGTPGAEWPQAIERDLGWISDAQGRLQQGRADRFRLAAGPG
ncbi:hypothetical protein FQR65_LT20702 [Abscondita terminalis]|nr:hypothetical protein FQR65_LT20702 [Abscondita terminalis]